MIKQGLMFLTVLGLGVPAWSGNMGVPKLKSGVKVITLSAGPAWYRANSSQSLLLQPDVIKRYVDHGETRVMPTAEIFFALQCKLSEQIYGQFGLTGAYTANAITSGDILEDADWDFNNYTYRYKINHARVGIKAKFLADLGYSFQPYLSGGIAAGFNHSFDYTITPKIFEEVPAPIFSNNSEVAFSYTVGLGVQTFISPHWQAGIGYEFADLGKSALGPAAGQLTDRGLHMSNLYTHELQLSLTYLV